MWSKTYSTKVKAVTPRQVWNVWTDVNKWYEWQDDIEYAKLDEPFQEGAIILFRPKGGPQLKIKLIKIIEEKLFVDMTNFLLAKMYDEHEILAHADGVEIKSTIRVEGLLTFVWRKLVAENVANGLQEQTDKLIAQINKKYG